MSRILGLVLLACLSLLHGSDSAVSDGVNRKSPSDLRRELFKNYDSKTIPVKNIADSIYTKASLSFLSIREMIEDKEVFVIDAWIKMEWNDSYLTWNPDNYDGIKALNVPSEDLWKPDITTYTASPDLKLLPRVATKAIIYNNGKVLWVPPLTVNSRCPMDFSKYPYDVQRCSIKVGSWTYSEKNIDLHLYDTEVDLNDFTNNHQEWSLEAATVEREVKEYKCCPGDLYPSIEYNITLKRRIAPEVYIADTISIFAGFLSLLMFWLPPDSIHKVILGMLAEILLGLAAVFLGLAIKAPAARLKATERIFPFMWVVAVAIAVETLILNLGRVMGPCRPPRCLVAVAKGCCQPFCVCISRPYPGGDLRAEILQSEKTKKHVPSAQEEWNIVAMAFDRLLFVAALLTTVFYYYLCK